MKPYITILLLFITTTTFSQNIKNEIKNRGFVDISGKLDLKKIREIDLNVDTVFSLSSPKSNTVVVNVKHNKISNTQSSSILNEYWNINTKESNSILSNDSNYAVKISHNDTIKSKIIAINRLNPYKTIVYFKLSDIGVNDILMTQSSNNEKKWDSPTIAIKHNKIDIEGWGVLNNYYKKNRELFMLLSDNSHNTYLSRSIDKGMTWSYPFGFSDEVIGTDFKISVHKDIVYLLFRSMKDTEDYKKGDVLIWFSNIKEFIKENSNGVTILIKKAGKQTKKINWNIHALSEKHVVIFKQEKDNNSNLLHIFSVYRSKKTVDFIY